MRSLGRTFLFFWAFLIVSIFSGQNARANDANLIKNVNHHHKIDLKKVTPEDIESKDLQVSFKLKLSPLNKFALWITNEVGTFGFFLVIFFWTLIWLGWNTLGPKKLRFDPYPGFVLWLFMSNVIQILLMPLILVGQNLQGMQQTAAHQDQYEIILENLGQVQNISEHIKNNTFKMYDLQVKLEQIEEHIKTHP